MEGGCQASAPERLRSAKSSQRGELGHVCAGGRLRLSLPQAGGASQGANALDSRRGWHMRGRCDSARRARETQRGKEVE